MGKKEENKETIFDKVTINKAEKYMKKKMPLLVSEYKAYLKAKKEGFSAFDKGENHLLFDI